MRATTDGRRATIVQLTEAGEQEFCKSTAARREADPSAQAGARRFLARAYTRLGRLDEAHPQLRHALRLYRQAVDQTGQGQPICSAWMTW